MNDHQPDSPMGAERGSSLRMNDMGDGAPGATSEVTSGPKASHQTSLLLLVLVLIVAAIAIFPHVSAHTAMADEAAHHAQEDAVTASTQNREKRINEIQAQRTEIQRQLDGGMPGQRLTFYLVRVFDVEGRRNVVEARMAGTLAQCVLLVDPEHCQEGAQRTFLVRSLGNRECNVVNSIGLKTWSSPKLLPAYEEFDPKQLRADLESESVALEKELQALGGGR